MQLPDFRASHTRLILALAVLGIILVGLVAYRWHNVRGLDSAAQAIFVWVGGVTSYTQDVETETKLSDRTLRVVGTHYVDTLTKRFAAYTTTTLTIPGPPADQSHTFTLHNIAIGDDVYTKIETDSALLQKTIPHSPEWRHFTRTTIPEAFQNISVPGPVLDNLRLFADDGAYVSITGRGETEEINGTTCTHYTFKLSGKKPTYGGSLLAILDRIGSGHIDVCATDAGAVLRMQFEYNAYRSTTLISAINSIPPVVAPVK